MISLEDSTKILNTGEFKFAGEEVKQIRELLLALATIEFENFIKEKSDQDKIENSNEVTSKKVA